MTDTAKPMTRDEAEKAARAGAKVRRNWWDKGLWVTFSGEYFHGPTGWPYWEFPGDGYDDGWSIVEPAPDTAKAETDGDLAAAIAMVDGGYEIDEIQRALILAAARKSLEADAALRKTLASWATRKPIPLCDVPGEVAAPSAIDRVRDLYAKKRAQGLVDVKFDVKPGATAEQLAEEILSMEAAIQAGQFKTLRFGDVTLKKATPVEPEQAETPKRNASCRHMRGRRPFTTRTACSP